ncbi:MAG: iron-sulfur cluster co-chaperone HscB C-terminal domain-containing protein [Bacteroidota bacterium]
MNYFDFFDLPIAPKVDQALLKKKFYENSRKYHPDFYTLASPEKQAEVLELSTLNNQGYLLLKEEDATLKYLLELKGYLGGEGENKIPQDFLLEVMDINETLMELEFDDDPALRQKASQQTEALEKSLEQDVRELLDKYDDSTVSPDELNRLRDYYLKQRYLLRIREKI